MCSIADQNTISTEVVAHKNMRAIDVMAKPFGSNTVASNFLHKTT